MDDEIRTDREATLSYVNDQGDDVDYTMRLSPEGLAAVLLAMDNGAVD